MSTIPSVDVEINENSLGLQDPAAGDSLAIIGPATSGDLLPLLYGRTGSVQADYVSGALVEAAADGLEITGRPVVLVRTETSTPGAMGAVDVTEVAGTAVVIATPGAEPIDDLEAEYTVVDGGTVGTDGITYTWSHDGGRRMSPLASLGTSTVIAPEGGVSFTLDPASADVTLLIAFAVEARSDALAHFANVTAHDAADTSAAQVALAASSVPTTAAQAWAVLNLCRTAYEAHRVNVVAHNSADSTNVIAHAAATNSTSSVALAIEYAVDWAAHLANATAHNSADVTNTIAAAAPAMPTLAAGDTWTCRTSMPASSDVELDAALLSLQVASYAHKSILILSPVTSTATANAIKTRFNTMKGAYKYKKLFCNFRMPNIGETEAAYLAAYKAAFDAIECFGISMAAGAVEYQSSATKGRTYRRPPSWLLAPWHVKRGPDVSVAFVDDGAGAMPLGATIKDVNGNPKHHDETLDPGLDAARAVTLRSHAGYVGKAFFTRARTLGKLGTDYMFLHYWAVMIEALDVAVPKLIGQIQDKVAPDPDTGRILESAARDIELGVEHEVDSKVTAKGWIVSVKCTIDRTFNIYKTPKIPIVMKVVPFGYNDGFELTVMLDNPQFSNS